MGAFSFLWVLFLLYWQPAVGVLRIIVQERYQIKLYVLNPSTGTIVSQIESDKITVKSNTVFKKEFVHVINKTNSERYSENRIVLSVKVIGSGKEKKKELQELYNKYSKYKASDEDYKTLSNELSTSLHEIIEKYQKCQ